MALTAEQIKLINESFRTVVMRTDTAADLFYEHLFELRPAVKPLFKGNMREQGRKFMQMIGTLVGTLHIPDDYHAAIEHLGRRHSTYGVQDADYAVVGEAFIWALGRVLGDAFTPDVRAAWETLYADISGTIVKMPI